MRQETRGDVLVLIIDNPPVNASSQAVRAGVLAGIERLREHDGLAGAVLVGARGSFIAGSDISEFDGVVPDPLLPAVIAAIETCPRPVVAALDGLALGGGLELALGCDARLATPQAVVGLPEVTLGMVPGAGGTQRLPRLTGRAAALDLIVSGRRVGAAEARRLGIVDDVVDDDVVEAAVTLARTIGKRRVGDLPMPPEDEAAYDAFEKAATAALRRTVGAAGEAAELVRTAGTRPLTQALLDERARFDRLRTSPEAAALRHVFFAERAAPRRGGVRPAVQPVTRAGVVGAGAMGVGIAVALATHGASVHLIDRDPAQAERALGQARDLVARAARRGRLDTEAAERASRSLSASAAIADLGGSQLVVEAVFEDPDVKAAVLRSAQEVVPRAVLATNTSYLGVGRLAETLDDPTRLVGLHFFAPAHVMRLVEVVAGERTAPEAVALALRAVRDMEKCAVLAGDSEGFIGNRVFAVYRRHVEYLLEDGALPAEVDAALEGFGFAMGPFAVADLSGLQIAQSLRRRWRATDRLPARYVDIPDELCDRGRLGRRTGAGYYTYAEDGTRSVAAEVTELVLSESRRKGIARQALDRGTIVTRAVAAMAVEGARAVAAGVAAHCDDVDVAMVNGFGFPRHRGGPMWWARQQDPDEFAAAVRAVTEAAHEDDLSELVAEVLRRA
ncbi:MAG TPA: 3-hydroxyacyl-CoA dehydrogenase NAD-binding domain-containing protein [Nocardioides sp.]|nr:3-hydroxyacyl-CoA dehydrogenase NAD-binding domain-containing protein [Nocardioides sp.]